MDAFKQRNAVGWSHAAEGYAGPDLPFAPFGVRLAEEAPLFPGDRVLDLACGTGAVARVAAARVAPEGGVVGVDLAPAMLAQARAGDAAPAITFAQMDAERLGFADESFTVVLSGLGLFFLPDMAGGLQECARVLQPGGRLAFTAFGKGFLAPLNHLLAARIRTHGLPPNPVVKQMAWEPEDLRDLVEDAGFFMVRATRVAHTLTLPTPEHWWRLLWYGAFRVFAYDAPPETLAQFKAEHLAEVAAQAGPEGLVVQMPIVTVTGVRR